METYCPSDGVLHVEITASEVDEHAVKTYCPSDGVLHAQPETEPPFGQYPLSELKINKKNIK